MTATAELLTELQARGIRVRAAGDRLRYAPREVLDADPDLRARVAAAKPELLRMLGCSLGGLAVCEVLGFRAAWLADPIACAVPFELVLAVAGVAEPARVTFASPAVPRAFVASEWLAMVEAAEHDRAWPADLTAWCERKREHPSWRLTRAKALGSVNVEGDRGWTVDRVLQRIGAELRAVVIEGGSG